MSEDKPEAGEEAHGAFLSGADLQHLMKAKADAENAAKAEQRDAAKAARDAEIEEMRKPLEITEEHMASAISRFRRAAEAGQTELMVFKFPVAVCEDNGRAIYNALPEWPESLIGHPRAIYDAWERHLKDRGYGLHARVINFEGDVPGEAGLFVTWRAGEQDEAPA